MPLDTAKLSLKVKINREGKKSGKKANWTFYVSDKPEEMRSVEKDAGDESQKTETQKEVVAVVQPKAVKPDEEFYKLTCSAGFEKDAAAQTKLPVEWNIYPGIIDLDVQPKAGHERLKGEMARLRLGGLVREGTMRQRLYKQFGAQVGKSQQVRLDSVGLNDGHLELKADSPWVLEVKNGPEIKQKCQVEVHRLPYVAAFHTHTADEGKTQDAPLQQWVNLESDKVDSGAKGNVFKIMIGADERVNALKGDKFHVRVTFPKEIKYKDGTTVDASPRRDPSPALWFDEEGKKKGKLKAASAKPGKADLVYDYTGDKAIELKEDGELIELFIQMGYAGGTTCKVEIGVTEDVQDDVRWFQAWRELKLDMVQPQKDTVSNYTVFKPDGSGGLTDAQINLVKKQLDKAFIDFSIGDTFTYSAADISNNGQYNIYDGSHFELASGGKVVLLTEAQCTAIESAKRAQTKKRAWFTTWADAVQVESAPTQVSEEMDSAAAKEVAVNASVFKYDIVKADGTLGISEIAWRVEAFEDSGNWVDIYTQEGVDAFGGDDAAVQQVEDLAQWRRLQNPDQATVDKYVELVHHRKVKLKLPSSDADDAGNFLQVNGVKLKVTVYVAFASAWFPTNASALQGSIWMGADQGSWKNEGLMATLLHEMGHNMGQAYGKHGKDTGGHTGKAVPGVPFEAKVPKGKFYTGHDHTGGHCAEGLSKADRKKASFGGLNGTCIMFGEGSMSSSTELNYCDTCLGYLRAVHLDDISKSW